MIPLTTLSGRAYPFGMKNCDTDVIISSEWLKTLSRVGLGRGAFATIRRNGDSVFDDPVFAESPILIAGGNFGCGSSREHAAWALSDMGIRVVIAPSFSDIFSGNAFKNGILTIALDKDAVDKLLEIALTENMRVDLQSQFIETTSGLKYLFKIDRFRKICLINGLDEIGIVERSADAIKAFAEQRKARLPWSVPNPLV